jgi:hypothetical protein
MPMRPCFLSTDDLDLATQACRSLVRRYRVDAERQKNPLVQQASTESAEKLERLADRMQRFRGVSAS